MVGVESRTQWVVEAKQREGGFVKEQIWKDTLRPNSCDPQRPCSKFRLIL